MPAYRHRLLGVYDGATGEPLEGAEVTDLKSGTKALTTKTGTVSLVFLPDGGSEIRVRKMGYEPSGRFVSISPTDTVPLTMLLIASTTMLPTMVTRDTAPHYISPGLRDFEERRKSGPGHFITEAELRKSDNRKMKDVLERLPGLQILCARTMPFDCHALSLRASNKYAILRGEPCGFTIYVDGMLSMEQDLNHYNVNDYAGVESYTGGSTIPIKYNTTGNACGVLLFWSRER